MNKNARRGTSQKNFVNSFLLLVALIGSSISSIGLMGLTISPQQAWAAVPSAPSLTTADGLITDDTTPTLQWGRLTGANAPTSYNIQIDNDGSGFPSPTTASVAQPGSGGTVSFTSPVLALGSYAWRVQGVNADGSGPFSTTRTFTVTLEAPILVTPLNGANENSDETPTFTWNRFAGATSYKIQISVLLELLTVIQA